MKRLLIYGNCKPVHADRLSCFFNALMQSGASLFAERNLADSLSKLNIGNSLSVIDTPDDVESPYCTISLGGDGTFLQTAQWIGSRDIPIMGLNLGHLGFLTAFSLKDDPEMVADMIMADKLCSDTRRLLTIKGDVPKDIWPYALNEVAIFKEETASMINTRTLIDGSLLADYLGDGLVISTPTGSTGYNLSVGGPILQPELDCLVLSPIAPHTLTLRPMVVSGSSQLLCTTTSRAADYRVSLDGRSFLMRSGSSITVLQAPYCIRILHAPGFHFAATLRAKLLWGRR